MPNTHTKSENAKTGMVFFVGAGPGDPELLTLKGRKAIEGAGLVLYAGSLVPPEVVACAGPDARVADSAPLTLEECHQLVRETALAGKDVARVHTGDPSLYGALREQIALLERDGIPWQVIPGVTAACADPQRDYYEEEYRIRKADGNLIWALEKGRLATDEDGEQIYIKSEAKRS